MHGLVNGLAHGLLIEEPVEAEVAFEAVGMLMASLVQMIEMVKVLLLIVPYCSRQFEK